MLPTGIWHNTYSSETRVLETQRSRIWLLALIGALIAAPWLAGPWLLGEFTHLFITLTAVYGLYVTVGMAGQINIAQSAFVGVGAFGAAKLSMMGVPFWAAIPAAALASGIISIFFALPAARVSGFYLALTTLAAQVIFPIAVLAMPTGWFGGLVGMPVFAPTLFGFNLGTPLGFYFLALACAALATWCAFNLRRSRIGRALRAVHDNDIAADVMGIPVTRIKVEAFFIGALFAGVSGAVMAYFLQFVTVTNFTLFTSVWYLGMLIVGGMHSPLGPILGVTFVMALQEGLHAAGNLMIQSGIGLGGSAIFAISSIALAVCILCALVFEPRGLAHIWHSMVTGFRLWPFPKE